MIALARLCIPALVATVFFALLPTVSASAQTRAPVKASTTADSRPPVSSIAEAVYARSKSRILQIRTLLNSAGGKSTIGSGFQVSADGLAVTNYHVIAQYALEPKTYRLEYAAPDGGKGGMTLLAIDVANDLAVVRLDRLGRPDDAEPPHFEFDSRALADALPKGERIYAMGNPLDIGFTIVEGTYNGLVDKSYDERIHLSGAINPGMSGGPVTNAEGRVVGINVAKRTDAEQVGFLVPAKFAARLVESAKTNKPLDVGQTRAEISRQLAAWQAGFYTELAKQGFKNATFGPYLGLESAARWMNCWANTNANAVPRPRHLQSSTRCDSQTGLYVSNQIYTGRLTLDLTLYQATDLNAFQFANLLSGRGASGTRGNRRMTEQICRHDFVAGDESRPRLRATWCARAYREFEGLYDVTVIALTQDRDREALHARLSMRGVGWDNANALAKRFLESLRFTTAAADPRGALK
ncbi:MAG: trypsin-like peptidase domain-containing protein [Betaproteobacteria bacterium]|nr:trypsin-like peptidase domain-containing protein [Betaproteobacteria bacterium]